MNVSYSLLIAFACHTAMAQSDQRAHALDAIVGEWQSDTTGGTSARTTCGWTPAKLSVICEQLLDTRRGIQRVQNFYTFDPATGRYFFYGPLRPGAPMNPVPLKITHRLWIYPEPQPDAQGLYWRTVNDFTKPGEYAWRRESSPDGQHWTKVAGGRSVSKRPISK